MYYLGDANVFDGREVAVDSEGVVAAAQVRVYSVSVVPHGVFDLFGQLDLVARSVQV